MAGSGVSSQISGNRREIGEIFATLSNTWKKHQEMGTRTEG